MHLLLMNISLRVDLLGHEVCICSFFENGCTNWQSHQQYIRILIALHLCQHLELSVFLILAILVGGFVVLICINLITNDVEHVLIRLLTIYISLFVKYLFKFLLRNSFCWIICLIDWAVLSYSGYILIYVASILNFWKAFFYIRFLFLM